MSLENIDSLIDDLKHDLVVEADKLNDNQREEIIAKMENCIDYIRRSMTDTFRISRAREQLFDQAIFDEICDFEEPLHGTCIKGLMKIFHLIIGEVGTSISLNDLKEYAISGKLNKVRGVGNITADRIFKYLFRKGIISEKEIRECAHIYTTTQGDIYFWIYGIIGKDYAYYPTLDKWMVDGHEEAERRPNTNFVAEDREKLIRIARMKI